MAARPLTGSGSSTARAPPLRPSAGVWLLTGASVPGSTEPPGGLVFRPAASGHCQGSVHTPESELPVLVLFLQEGLLSAHSHCGIEDWEEIQSRCVWLKQGASAQSAYADLGL